MNGFASVAAAPLDGAIDAVEPVVLIDAAPQPGLVVESFDVRGPLDERTATLRAVDDRCRIGRRAVIAIPVGLVDDTTRWIVLAKGELSAGTRRVEAGRDERTIELVDDWAARLVVPLDAIWWINADGALIEQSTGVMRAGPAGNRSIDTHMIDNQPIHVLQTAGRPWTVAAALATLSALHGLGLALTLLPQHVVRAQLVQDVDLTRPVGEVLRRIVEPYGLFVQRDLVRDGNTLIERRAVRHVEHARPVRLRWGRDDQPIGACPVEKLGVSDDHEVVGDGHESHLVTAGVVAAGGQRFALA